MKDIKASVDSNHGLMKTELSKSNTVKAQFYELPSKRIRFTKWKFHKIQIFICNYL